MKLEHHGGTDNRFALHIDEVTGDPCAWQEREPADVVILTR